jgi:hypothetical protein
LFKHGKRILLIDATVSVHWLLLEQQFEIMRCSSCCHGSSVKEDTNYWEAMMKVDLIYRDIAVQGLFVDGTEEDDHQAFYGMFSSLFEVFTYSYGVVDVGLRL